jgi:Tol biopolymer transport system component/predicted Ser/Thr protein kinase
MTDSVPEKLGKYEIIEEVGRGGFAAVYKAMDTTLDRTVALKVLAPHLLWDPTFVQRFQREAKVAANLDRSNIVTIYEVSQIEGVYFIAMQFLEGRTLGQILEAEGPWPVSRVQAVIEQVASALDYAHARGFVHRDIKPSNIMVASDGKVTLTDFGLVKAGEGTKLSTTGVVFGTPEYMSPEQAEGKELDARSDVYSLGVVVYEMLTGKVPFGGMAPLSIMRGHADKPPPRPAEINPDVSPAVEAVLLKALAKKREERYQSAGKMAVALQQAVSRAVMEEAKAPPPVAAPPLETPSLEAERALAPARPALPWKWVAGIGAVVVVALCVVVGLVIAPKLWDRPTTRPTSAPEVATLAPTATLTTALVPLTPTPSPTPYSGRIVFDSYRDGNLEIYVMNADGSGLKNLTNNPAGDYVPSWSPDSTRIAFASKRDGNHEIYVMNADGSGQTRLTDDPAEDYAPCWSLDSTHVAFQSDRDGDYEIYVMNADGSGQTRLTNNPANDHDPSWSPDCMHIAFYSDRDGNQEIYVMNADGSGQTRLTNNPADDYYPSWSPDGTRIAFTSKRDGNREIYVMNVDGSEQTRLTNNLASDYYPSWSPDSTRIAFTSERDGNGEIYVMNTDGSGLKNLTGNPADDWWPFWGP